MFDTIDACNPILCLWFLSCTGKGLVLALAEKGVFITIVDFSQEKGRETATLVQKINTKFHPNLQHPSVLFVKCDVTNSSKYGYSCCVSIPCSELTQPWPTFTSYTRGSKFSKMNQRT